MVPALFDGLKSLPPATISALHLKGFIKSVGNFLPLSGIGMDWVVPAVIGFVIGILLYALKIDKGQAAS